MAEESGPSDDGTCASTTRAKRRRAIRLFWDEIDHRIELRVALKRAIKECEGGNGKEAIPSIDWQKGADPLSAHADSPGVDLITEERRLRLALPSDVVTLRAWWKAVEAVLRQFDEPVPRDLRSVLAKMASYLGVGKLPDPIGNVHGEGGSPGAGPDEIYDIRVAATYLYLVDNGCIADKTSRKTIRNTYSVSSSTVRGWYKLYRDDPIPLLMCFPAKAKRAVEQSGDRFRMNREKHQIAESKAKPDPVLRQKEIILNAQQRRALNALAMNIDANGIKRRDLTRQCRAADINELANHGLVSINGEIVMITEKGQAQRK